MPRETSAGPTLLEKLAHTYGIQTEYWGIDGKCHAAQPQSVATLLRCMGVAHVEEPQRALHDYETNHWQCWLEPVQVICLEEIHTHGLRVPVRLPSTFSRHSLTWQIHSEDGRSAHGTVIPDNLDCLETHTVQKTPYQKRLLCISDVEAGLGLGYHVLRLTDPANGRQATSQLMVTPSTCYLPETLRQGERFWGPAVQLYSLRSQRDWGIGDFSCLKELAAWATSEQADLVGLNPLNGLNLQCPEGASPYSPCDRLFLNPLYIDVEALPDFARWQTEATPERLQQLRDQLSMLRDQDQVSYATVARLKLGILEELYERFQRHHLESASSSGKAFQTYLQQGGERLDQFGIFMAAQEAQHGADWAQWPAAYQDAQHLPQPLPAALQERAGFFRYLQWLAHDQLAAVSRTPDELAIGLYLDFPVGTNRGGFEVWRNRHLYALTANVGAPPDPLGPSGQDWGLPPLIPHRLRQAAYKPVIESLRQTMQLAGALRLDHVAGLSRLFWIPAGAAPVNGAYVQYQFDELLGIVALESHRNHCLMIGEDLGTIPDLVRQKMDNWKLLSYKVVRWERDWQAALQPCIKPEDYARFSLVVPSTHDTPTLAGMVMGTFYDVLYDLGLMDQAQVERAKDQADQDNLALLVALKSEGLLPETFALEALKASIHQLPHDTFQRFCDAVHRFTARTQSAVALFTLEDALGQILQVNIPGTADAEQPDPINKTYPNWRRRLPLALEAFSSCAPLQRVAEAFRQER